MSIRCKTSNTLRLVRDQNCHISTYRNQNIDWGVIEAYHKCITSNDTKQRWGINTKPFSIFQFNFQSVYPLMQYGYEGWVRMRIHPHIALIHRRYLIFVASKTIICWFQEHLALHLVQPIAIKHHSLHGLVQLL